MHESIMSDYGMRKKCHYCVTCGRQDAYTLNGRARCFECQNKQNKLHRSHPEYEEKRKVRKQAKYYERKAAGLCVVCEKPAEKGKTRCLKHLCKDRANHKHKELNRVIASEIGICVTCLKEPALYGHKLCESCYQKSVANIAKARTCVKNRKPLIFGKLINGRNQDA